MAALIYIPREGGFSVKTEEGYKVKYKVSCGVAHPMFMHYAVNALEQDNTSEQLQWLYNSVMEDYIEKDKIHSTLDGKVLVSKEDLNKLLESYTYLHASSYTGNMFGEPRKSQHYHNLKGAINNDT